MPVARHRHRKVESSLRPAVVLILLLLSASSVAQVSEGSTVPKPGDSVEVWLKSNGVETDARSLVAFIRESPESPSVSFAILLLTLRRNPEARELFREIVADPRFEEDQSTIAWGLARLGEPSGASILESLLGAAKEDGIRLRLASRLADVGRVRGFSTVVELSQDPEAEVRSRVLEIMIDYLAVTGCGEAKLEEEEVLKQILRLSRDTEAVVRETFVRLYPVALWEGAGKTEILERLREMCKEDPSENIRLDLQEKLNYWAFSEGRLVKDGETCP